MYCLCTTMAGGRVQLRHLSEVQLSLLQMNSLSSLTLLLLHVSSWVCLSLHFLCRSAGLYACMSGLASMPGTHAGGPGGQLTLVWEALVWVLLLHHRLMGFHISFHACCPAGELDGHRHSADGESHKALCFLYLVIGELVSLWSVQYGLDNGLQ